MKFDASFQCMSTYIYIYIYVLCVCVCVLGGVYNSLDVAWSKQHITHIYILISNNTSPQNSLLIKLDIILANPHEF